jgi:hypothetical protein
VSDAFAFVTPGVPHSGQAFGPPAITMNEVLNLNMKIE